MAAILESKNGVSRSYNCILCTLIIFIAYSFIILPYSSPSPEFFKVDETFWFLGSIGAHD